MIDRKFLEANHADIVAAIRLEGHQAGHAEGVSAGAAAERTRILAIETASMPGCEALIETLKADGKTTGPEAAAAVLADYKKQNATALGKLKADASAVPNVPATPSSAATGPDAAAAPAKDSAQAFDAAIAANITAGLSRGKAIGKAARELPAAHAAWIELRNAA